jgi:hypothetical protein
MGRLSKAWKSATKFVGNALGAVGDAISGTFKAVVDTVKKTGEAITKIVSSTFNAIEKAVNQVGDALKELEDFAKPLIERYAIQVALVAMGIPPQFAAPMSAGMHTLAKGGSPEDALKSAATVAVIQQAGQSVQGGMEAANADAIAQGGQAVYSAAEIAAATSAAQSAVAAAATGGDVKQILTSAAIGGVTGAAATEVYKATGSIAAANFTRVSLQTTLQGVEVKEAILMGASASMVSYLQTMNKYANEASDISRSRAASIEAYKARAEGYNAKLDQYNQARDAGDVATANRLADELNAELPIINNLSNQIGSFNAQIKDLTDKYSAEQEKAKTEAQKTGFDFKPKTDQMLAAEQEERDALAEELIKLVGETEGRRYEGIQVAGELPAAIEESIKTVPLVGEEGSDWQDLGDGRLSRTVTTQDANGNVRQYNILLDPETNEVTYSVPEYATQDNPLGEVSGRPNYRSMVGTPQQPTQLTPEMEAQGYTRDEQGSIRSPSGALFIEITTGGADKPELVEDVGELVGQRPTLTEAELAAINAQARETRGTSIRGAVEQDLFEQELEQFEQELQNAEDAAEKDAARLEFAQKQRERLAQANRLPGTLQAQIDAELESILDEYERTKGVATEAASRREQVVASQQERAGTASDEEIMRLIGLTPDEGERYGLGRGTGTGFRPTEVKPISEQPPELPEGEMELGGGEGEGEPPARRFDAQGRAITTTAVEAGDRTREAGTPGISSRVTGEALVGILGEKEPLFGGDEDEQRAVWNRRSLRLRKALGL